MSPTPVTFTLADRPGLVQLGGHRRGGRRALRRPDRATIVRFDLNTSPAPPALVARLLAAGALRDAALRVPAVRLPPARRGRRRALRRRDRTRSSSGAGADEILDLVGKAFLPAGRRGGRPDPDLRDVPGHHRAARRDASSPSRASAAAEGWALDVAGRPRGRPRRARSSGCAARTTRPPWPSPTARSRRSSTSSPATPPRTAATAPVVVLDEAYAEFVGRVAARLCAALSATSSSSGPPARPTRWPGCASGSRSRAPSSSRGSTRTARRARSRPSRSRSSPRPCATTRSLRRRTSTA